MGTGPSHFNTRKEGNRPSKNKLVKVEYLKKGTNWVHKLIIFEASSRKFTVADLRLGRI